MVVAMGAGETVAAGTEAAAAVAGVAVVEAAAGERYRAATKLSLQD
jgi:hypothetical protein